MSKERIEKAMREFDNLDPAKGERPFRDQHRLFMAALAEHVAAVLPPSVDGMLQVVRKYNEHTNTYNRILLWPDGSGHLGNSGVIKWDSVAQLVPAINAAMKPELTVREKALKAVDQLIESLPQVGLLTDVYAHIATIRNTLMRED